MVAILVLGMFVLFFVVERIINKKAPKYVFQTAPSAEAVASRAQPIVAAYEVPEHLRLDQVRERIDRRQADRRGPGSQSAA